MSDEPARLAEGMEAPLREPHRIENHACEHAGCGHRAPFGFARPKGPSYWFCREHRADGDQYLFGGRHQ